MTAPATAPAANLVSQTDRHADDFVTLIGELLAVPSPPAHEHRLAQLISRKLASYGYAPETDPAGNVLVRLAGRQPDAPLMVMAAHIDEIAMVVTAIESDGSLRVARSGSLVPSKIGEGPVELFGDRDEPVMGVLAFGSGHSGGYGTSFGGHQPPRGLMWQDVHVITGLSPQQLTQAGIRVGSTATPPAWRRGPMILGDPADPMIAAWTFDDRGGVASLMLMLQQMKQDNIAPVRPMIVAFTTQEEGGCHGAKVLAQRERPEIFMAVDGAARPAGTSLTMDGRPAAWSMDAKAHSDQRLVRQLAAAARAAGTELQTVVYQGAYSDASEVLNAGAAPRVVTFGHVRDSSHGFEVARLSSFGHCIRTLLHFVQDDAT